MEAGLRSHMILRAFMRINFLTIAALVAAVSAVGCKSSLKASSIAKNDGASNASGPEASAAPSPTDTPASVTPSPTSSTKDVSSDLFVHVVGDNLKIKGTDLQSTDAKAFLPSGEALPIVSREETQLVVTVPADAPLGVIDLLVAGTGWSSTLKIAIASTPQATAAGTIDSAKLCANSSLVRADGSTVNGQAACGAGAGGGPTCSGDGETNCVLPNGFKASDPTTVVASDIRLGKSIAGVAGQLKFCKSATKLGTFATPQDDIFDTYAPFTTAASDVATGNPWPLDEVCDADDWADRTADGVCDSGGDECAYQDKHTRLWWSEEQVTGTWSAAVSRCENLSWAGQTDWRLPTQKEVLQAAVDGIYSLNSAYFLYANCCEGWGDHWSSTTNSIDDGGDFNINTAWVVFHRRANIWAGKWSATKTYNLLSSCVREGN